MVESPDNSSSKSASNCLPDTADPYKLLGNRRENAVQDTHSGTREPRRSIRRSGQERAQFAPTALGARQRPSAGARGRRVRRAVTEDAAQAARGVGDRAAFQGEPQRVARRGSGRRRRRGRRRLESAQRREARTCAALIRQSEAKSGPSEGSGEMRMPRLTAGLLRHGSDVVGIVAQRSSQRRGPSLSRERQGRDQGERLGAIAGSRFGQVFQAGGELAAHCWRRRSCGQAGRSLSVAAAAPAVTRSRGTASYS